MWALFQTLFLTLKFKNGNSPDQSSHNQVRQKHTKNKLI